MKTSTDKITQNINYKKQNIALMYIGNTTEAVYELATLNNFNVSLKHHNNYIKALDDIKYNKFYPDCIICDLEQNGTDALKIYELLNDNLPLNTCKIILTKSTITPQLIKESEKLKINDIIKYPFDKNEFSENLKYLTDSESSENKISQSLNINNKKHIAKRIFDFTFSLIALLLISPILIVIAIMIKVDSKGPVFYTSKRVGKGYHIFNFYKFRTMRTDADQLVDKMKDLNQYKENKNTIVEDSCIDCHTNGKPCSPELIVDGKTICENHYQKMKRNNEISFVKFKNDPRITKLGQFLRSSSIDELPQLLNILKGDMSFVGNRPLPLYEAEQLTTDEFIQRFNAPAGLTGLWQVSKRGKSEMSELERKQLDNTYAQTNSFFGDLILILRTFPALTQKENV